MSPTLCPFCLETFVLHLLVVQDDVWEPDVLRRDVDLRHAAVLVRVPGEFVIAPFLVKKVKKPHFRKLWKAQIAQLKDELFKNLVCNPGLAMFNYLSLMPQILISKSSSGFMPASDVYFADPSSCGQIMLKHRTKLKCQAYWPRPLKNKILKDPMSQRPSLT